MIDVPRKHKVRKMMPENQTLFSTHKSKVYLAVFLFTFFELIIFVITICICYNTAMNLESRKLRLSVTALRTLPADPVLQGKQR